MVTVPKDKGGLGIKDLYVQNDALLLNHVRDSKGFGEELGRIGMAADPAGARKTGCIEFVELFTNCLPSSLPLVLS